ncbi:uncharacterized protein VNE69_06205 [Vairimorpha necatrix]|uniref:Uncharacterized protein n=1 Tax=Vairimorpha necatrix TaxID=6039 RepID=A0AAX4JD61_9MICR
MIFPSLNLFTAFCSDYLLIIPSTSTDFNIYLSLNNLDNISYLSILIAECHPLEHYNEITNIFSSNSHKSLYRFNPITSNELNDLLKFKIYEDLEMINLFYNNKFILKTTLSLVRNRSYYITGMFFYNNNNSNCFYKTSKRNIFFSNKMLQEIKWGFCGYSEINKERVDVSKLCEEEYFKPEDFTDTINSL